MSINSLGQYTPNHKAYDHFGNIIPNVINSEGITPAFPFKPAPWLPVQFYEKQNEDWFVILPGKILSLDPLGYVMPAHYGLGASATVTYTTSDVAAGTIDITTGVAVTGATAYATSDINGSTYGFLGRQGLSFGYSTAKYPVGVAPYAFYKWAGDASEFDDGSNPLGLYYNNYQQQHQVSVICDTCLTLPLIPGKISTEALPTNWSAGAFTFGTKAVKTRAVTAASTARYNATTGFVPVLSTYPVIAFTLDNYPVAKNTTHTPITSTVSGMLVTEVDEVSAVTASGQFWVDYSVGVVFVYSADGQTLPSGFAAGTVTYYHYASAPSVYSSFACVLSTTTELLPGEFLKCGGDSNWVRATAGTDDEHIIGQVLGFETHPKDALDRVRTGYLPAINTSASGTMSGGVAGSGSVHLGQLDQMPGSATSGMPAALHYAGGSNLMVIVNVIGR